MVRNTPLGFRVSASFLPALHNFDSLIGSVQGTVIGKVHLERQGMCRAAHISNIRLLDAVCVEEGEKQASNWVCFKTKGFE